MDILVMYMYKIKVNTDQCIGSASCVAIAPQTFQLNDQNQATVISQTGDDAATQLSAAKACPVNAIIIVDVDEAGKETQVWPPIE
jgi:ferredoxin